MPAKNAQKLYAPDGYYHVYNRGAGKQSIFIDTQDKEYFLHLFARYLDPEHEERRGDGNSYPKYEASLLCYCLMGNHFHLLFQIDQDTQALSGMMRSLMTAYTMYFNLRHKRSGHLFQGVYKASPVDTDSYLLHISRYIHLNPTNYLAEPWSSIRYYLGETPPSWLHPQPILDLTPEYQEFLQDYEAYKYWLESTKIDEDL